MRVDMGGPILSPVVIPRKEIVYEIPTWFEDGDDGKTRVNLRAGTKDTRVRLDVGGGIREVEIEDLRAAISMVEAGESIGTATP